MFAHMRPAISPSDVMPIIQVGCTCTETSNGPDNDEDGDKRHAATRNASCNGS